MLTQLYLRGRVFLVLALLKPRRSKCVFTAMVFGLLLALLALPNLVKGQGANATLLGTVRMHPGRLCPTHRCKLQMLTQASGRR
jgi:hypothetical protein